MDVFNKKIQARSKVNYHPRRSKSEGMRRPKTSQEQRNNESEFANIKNEIR